MISFVVPAHNESAYIFETVNTIHRVMGNNDYYEIVVVDNASLDDTRKILEGLPIVKTIPLDTKVSISKTRNIGVSFAKGDVLVFIDADILITPEWADTLQQFLPDAEAHPLLISGYRCSLSKKPSWIELVWFDKMKTPKNPSYVNSGNLITTRKLFDEIKGFDENLTTGEDVDFCRRAVEKGAKIAVNKGFFVHHEGYPRTLEAFYRREQWHGIGDVESIDKFLSSKVALFSCGNMFLFLLAVALMIAGFGYIFLAICILLLAINAYALFKRFNIATLNDFASIFLLHIVYLIARSTSVVAKRMKRKR